VGFKPKTPLYGQLTVYSSCPDGTLNMQCLAHGPTSISGCSLYRQNYLSQKDKHT